MNVLVLAALTDATGNAVTARRIAAHLSQSHEVTLVDATTATQSSLKELVREHGIRLAIGVHALLAGPFLHRLGVPYVLVFGGTDLYEQADELHQKQMAKAVAGAARLVAFSPENRARAEWLWPATQGRVECVPQAVRANLPTEKHSIRARLGLGPNDLLVLLPTGIRRVKDPTHVVEAFSVWNVVEPRAHLVVVGAVLEPDYAFGAMRALVERPGVHYLPALPRPALLAAIAEADIVINTSLSEGMCGVLLEAMCLGVPVVARRNAGNESIVVHGHNGLLYDSPSELIHWARALDASVELRGRLAATAQRRIRDAHSPERERDAYLRIARETAPHGANADVLSAAPTDEVRAVVATGRRLGLNEPILDALTRLGDRLRNAPELSRAVLQLGGLLGTAPPSVAIAEVHERQFALSLGTETAATLNLALGLMQVPAAEARNLTRGVSASVVAATLGHLTSWAHHLHASNGLCGITLDVLEFAQRYLRGELLQLGLLQFDLRPFWFPITVFRNKATRELVATTLDGRGLDLRTGTLTSVRPPMFDPALWDVALQPGTPMLEMWFPEAISKFTLQQIGAGMREAYALFERLSPETVPVGVCGEAWWLDPQVRDIVPTDSGIRELQAACALFPSSLSEAKSLRRIFGPEVDRQNLPTLPKGGFGPLQLAVAKLLEAPLVTLHARGGFVLREEAERLPEWK